MYRNSFRVMIMKEHECPEKQPIVKPAYNSVEASMQTPLGRLRVLGPVDPAELNEHRLADGLSCFRQSCRQHAALVDLAGQPDGLVFTASLAGTVVSYVSFQKPDYPWWESRCLPELLELGSIETDLSWRKMGITRILLESIFKNPDFVYFESYIVMAAHFVHSWDLKNTNMPPWNYREFMLKLFGSYGFTTWETVDPEIREHPCNILLARVGSKIDSDCVKLFTGSCLGTKPD
jgi:acetoin utilization protein AcuA